MDDDVPTPIEERLPPDPPLELPNDDPGPMIPTPGTAMPPFPPEDEDRRPADPPEPEIMLLKLRRLPMLPFRPDAPRSGGLIPVDTTVG